MKLTGACKEKFEEWYLPWIRDQRKDYCKFSNEQVMGKFYRKIPSEKYGVYVDFFDSVGEDVEWTASQLGFQSDKPRTRYEKWNEAIEKANEIYNKDN